MRVLALSAPVLCWIIWICGGCCKLNREFEYPEGVPDLGAPSGFFSIFTLLSRAFIPPWKYEGKIAAAARMSGLHFLRSVFILSQFDFVFQKVPKPCTFKGSGDHRNTKGNWELIFEISCAYYRSQTIGNKNWFGSEAFFFDMIFAFCRSAAFVEAQASHSTVIPCGKGRGRRQWPVFTGTVSFGFAVSDSAVSDVRKEILLIRPLMSIWHLA